MYVKNRYGGVLDLDLIFDLDVPEKVMVSIYILLIPMIRICSYKGSIIR